MLRRHAGAILIGTSLHYKQVRMLILMSLVEVQ